MPGEYKLGRYIPLDLAVQNPKILAKIKLEYLTTPALRTVLNFQKAQPHSRLRL